MRETLESEARRCMTERDGTGKTDPAVDAPRTYFVGIPAASYRLWMDGVGRRLTAAKEREAEARHIALFQKISLPVVGKVAGKPQGVSILSCRNNELDKILSFLPLRHTSFLPVEPAELDQYYYTFLGWRGLPCAHSSAARSQPPNVAAA